MPPLFFVVPLCVACSFCFAFPEGQEEGWQEETPSPGFPKATAGARRVEKEPRSWQDPDGRPLPFKSLDEGLEFLKTAKVIERKRIAEGTVNAGQEVKRVPV
jgi:hypothetical protein